jgi:hypothetical protein
VLLFHWNGKAWARAVFPYAGTTVAPVASDGNGGVWLVLTLGPRREAVLVIRGAATSGYGR